MGMRKSSINDEVCSMCGSNEGQEELVICNLCKRTAEHIYCMANPLFEVPALWWCEECCDSVHGATDASKKPKIACDGPNIKNNEGSAKICYEAILKHIGKSSVYMSVSANSQGNQEFSQSNKRLADASACGSSPNCVMKKKHVSNSKGANMGEMKNSVTVFHSDCEARKVGFQTPEMPLPYTTNPDVRPPRSHDLKACWKGIFEILEVVNHPYHGIRAHLPSDPCAVSPKADKISKNMPEKLKFKVVPRKDVWPRIFLLDPPTKEDIGIYFFACEHERYKGKYVRLLERLDLRDSALEACVMDTRLLLFPSEQLPLDSRQIDGEAYLWGIFQRLNPKGLSGHRKIKTQPGTATTTTSENSDELNVYCERNSIGIVKRKDNSNTGVPVRNRIIPQSSEALNSGKPNGCASYFDSDPEVPPGFSTIIRPGLTKKQGDGSTKSNFRMDGNSREVHVIREVGDESDPDVPPGFTKLLRPAPQFSETCSSGYKNLCETVVEGAIPSTVNGTSCNPSDTLEGCSLKVSGPCEVAPKFPQVWDSFPDVPPGFTRITPPGSTKTQEGTTNNCSKLTAPLDGNSGEVHVTRDRQVCNRDALIRSTGEPNGYQEPHSRKLCTKSSVADYSANNVANESHPDAHLGFPKISPLESSELCSSPQKNLVPDDWCHSAEYSGNDNHSCAEEEKKELRSPGSPEGCTKSYSMGKYLPYSSTLEKVSGLASDHSDRMQQIRPTSSQEPVVEGSDCAEENVVSERHSEVNMEVDMEIDTSGGEKNDHKVICIPEVDTLPNSLIVDLENDMLEGKMTDRETKCEREVDTPVSSSNIRNIDMSGDEKNDREAISICIPAVNTQPYSSVVDRETDMLEGKMTDRETKCERKVGTPVSSSNVDLTDGLSGNQKIDRKDKSTQGNVDLHISVKKDSGKSRSSVRFSLKKVANPNLSTTIPLCFSPSEPRKQPKYQTSKGRFSSSPQPIKEKHGFPPIEGRQPSMSKILPSAKEKICSSLVSSSREGPATSDGTSFSPNASSKEKQKNMNGRSGYAGGTKSKHNAGSKSLVMDLESTSAVKRKLLELKGTVSGRSVPKDDKNSENSPCEEDPADPGSCISPVSGMGSSALAAPTRQQELQRPPGVLDCWNGGRSFAAFYGKPSIFHGLSASNRRGA